MRTLFCLIAGAILLTACGSKQEKVQALSKPEADSVCIQTAEFLKKLVDDQQNYIDSLQDELNKLTTVRR
jgi:hypothetical protein